MAAKFSATAQQRVGRRHSTYRFRPAEQFVDHLRQHGNGKRHSQKVQKRRQHWPAGRSTHPPNPAPTKTKNKPRGGEQKRKNILKVKKNERYHEPLAFCGENFRGIRTKNNKHLSRAALMCLQFLWYRATRIHKAQN